ncbi:hypothetical protein AEQ27_02170 [Frigoribacterium sp. RIT-PI-h]|nr:hypothetical protein AEQ27_02170 [Frigoribacterium sp. RIT-PI-h]
MDRHPRLRDARRRTARAAGRDGAATRPAPPTRSSTGMARAATPAAVEHRGPLTCLAPQGSL